MNVYDGYRAERGGNSAMYLFPNAAFDLVFHGAYRVSPHLLSSYSPSPSFFFLFFSSSSSSSSSSPKLTRMVESWQESMMGEKNRKVKEPIIPEAEFISNSFQQQKREGVVFSCADNKSVHFRQSWVEGLRWYSHQLSPFQFPVLNPSWGALFWHTSHKEAQRPPASPAKVLELSSQPLGSGWEGMENRLFLQLFMCLSLKPDPQEWRMEKREIWGAVTRGRGNGFWAGKCNSDPLERLWGDTCIVFPEGYGVQWVRDVTCFPETPL